jgi:hypothetical protein
MIFKDSLELKKKKILGENGREIQDSRQTIKGLLRLEYLKNIIAQFFFNLQNGADHYNFRFWTTTFVFLNRFSKQNMFWKHNFIIYPLSLVE